MPIYKKENAPYLVKVNYTDKYGVAHQVVRQNKSTSTFAGAKKVEAELLLKYSNQQYQQANIDAISKMTFAELLEEYEETTASETRKSTQRGKNKAIRLYIKDFFKDIKVIDIDAPLCQKWKNYINKQTKDDGEPLALSYRRSIYKVLNAVFNYAIKYYNLTFNPLNRIGPFKDVNLIEDELQYWTLDEFNKFIAMFKDFCESKNGKTLDDLVYWGYYVEFNILYFCGLRKGESYCLTWNRIVKGTYSNSFKITESMDQKTTPYEITGPKNKSSKRKVPICERLQFILDEHYQRYQNVYGFSDDWFICGGLEPIKDTTLDKRKNRFAAKAGIQQIRIHDFRHSFASLLINGDVNIKTISKWMGHATVQETWNRYGHLYPEKENEAVQYLNKINKISVNDA
ncbi:MAG: site-specific integrase [Erysipelotrichales bacterium]|nr:site-specific integrase [Erysipelotrichales bacterium]